MRPRRAAFRHPLDRIFAAPSHVAILRVLLDAAEGMSGRQVARLAEVNHQACAAALGRLEECGVVQRQGAGQTQLLRLNRENCLVQDLLLPLLQRERETFPRLLADLRRVLAGHCARALVFGSVARGEERPESDLDLLVVARQKRDQEAARAAAEAGRRQARHRFGIRVNPIILTERAMARRQRRGDALVANILREGIAVVEARDRKSRG